MPLDVRHLERGEFDRRRATAKPMRRIALSRRPIRVSGMRSNMAAIGRAWPVPFG
jgi:hypothetical protein